MGDVGTTGLDCRTRSVQRRSWVNLARYRLSVDGGIARIARHFSIASASRAPFESAIRPGTKKRKHARCLVRIEPRSMLIPACRLQFHLYRLQGTNHAQ